MATPSPAPSNPERLAELGREVVAAALLKGRFVLRSGAVSDYYLNKYMLTTRPAILRRIAEEMAALVPSGTQRIAGPELGAVPLAAAVSMVLDIPSVFVRKQAKEYGTANSFEGDIRPGEKVVILEDVLTTGGEAIRSATALRDFGAEVVGIIGIIDREEGAGANIAAAGFTHQALFTKTSLGI